MWCVYLAIRSAMPCVRQSYNGAFRSEMYNLNKIRWLGDSMDVIQLNNEKKICEYNAVRPLTVFSCCSIFVVLFLFCWFSTRTSFCSSIKQNEWMREERGNVLGSKEFSSSKRLSKLRGVVFLQQFYTFHSYFIGAKIEIAFHTSLK